jgi:plastocyanin
VRRRLTLLIGTGAALVAAAPASAASFDVHGLDTLVWDQPDLKVAVGDTVTWSFPGTAQPHNIKGSSANWADFKGNPGVPGESKTFTFAAEGTYTYVCEIHATTMTGTVTVGSPPPPPPPPLSEQPFPNDSSLSADAIETGGVDTTDPRLRSVAAKRSGKRVRVSFRVNEQAVVTVRFLRGRKTVKTKRAATSGRGSVSVRGLKAGRYTVKVVATDLAGNDSSTRRASLRVR